MVALTHIVTVGQCFAAKYGSHVMLMNWKANWKPNQTVNQKTKLKKHLTKNLSKNQERDGAKKQGEDHLTKLLKSCNNNFLTLICMPEIVLTTLNQCYFMLSTCCIATCNIGMWYVVCGAGHLREMINCIYPIKGGRHTCKRVRAD